MGNKHNKSMKTWYNRFEHMTLFNLFDLIRSKYELNGDSSLEGKSIDFKELDEITNKYLRFGEDALAMHLRELFKKDLIDIVGVEDNLDIENIIGRQIEVTNKGREWAYILKDIKFQSIYRGPRYTGSEEKRVVKNHSKTFYNRQSLALILRLFNVGLQKYKEEKDLNGFENSNFEDNVFSQYGFEDILSLVHYSEKALDMHIWYLKKKNLLEEIDDKYRLTKFGLFVARLLKDIKYQSLYNIGKAKLEK